MQSDGISAALCQRLSALIGQNTGLHFPPERYTDLQRGIAAAAEAFGFQQAAHCAEWLLSTPLSRQQLSAVARHLTVGETYFFRDRKTFDALGQQVLPELLRRRRGRNQRLRLWSAACCTGEEPYSLAILVQQLLTDAPEWDVTILATDINEHYLQRAVAGVYGEWSFREAPTGFKERYFTRGPDGRFTIVPEIRRYVRFVHGNLALDVLPCPQTDLHAMDLILCRNVLMYFTPAHARALVDKLYGALTPDGWLAVSPSECSQVLFSRFVTVNFPGTVAYRKNLAEEDHPAAPLAEQSGMSDASVAPPLDPPQTQPHELAATARALANQGRLSDALAWSERWIAADKIDASAHYLQAMVLQEMGEREAARRSLNRVVYLQPQSALAHFALGNLARVEERRAEANRHFENALHALRDSPPHELLPESEGMTVGQLAEIITTLLSLPHRPMSARGGTSND